MGGPLDAASIEQFKEQGYVVVPGLFPMAQIDVSCIHFTPPTPTAAQAHSPGAAGVARAGLGALGRRPG